VLATAAALLMLGVAMTTALPLFRVTKRFTGGLLAGIVSTEETSVKFPVGFKCPRPVGGSPYVVEACEPVNPAPTAARKETLFLRPNLRKTEWSLQDASKFHLGWFSSIPMATKWCHDNGYNIRVES
jgi:hypothetical protein